MGTNEVPRAGGGLYWEGDEPDGREFRLGSDTNDVRKGLIARQIANDLVTQGWIRRNVKPEKLAARIGNSEIDNLIEFVRAVHAEMAAITDAARRGIPIGRGVLYATTFPCHHCARHIVAAGIMRVVYVAPYAKSLAAELHSDAILVDPPHRKGTRRRVTFEPFVGVGPARYLELFEMPPRKNDDNGAVLPFKPKKALPRLRETEPGDLVPRRLGYIRREERALELFGTIQERRGLLFKSF
jgi:cytidine deaminase